MQMQVAIKFLAVTTVVLALVPKLLATSITGAIGIGGSVTFNTTSAATATQVTSWIAPHVTLDSGTFAASPNQFAITPGPTAVVIFAPGVWNFNTTSQINNFWAVGGFTFQLLSSFVVTRTGTPGTSGYVVVDGTGIVSGHGYTPTQMSWSFTATDPGVGNPISWTFNASVNSTTPNSVPDGGSTIALLGLALSGVTCMRKKFAACL